jgi:hypothetical protein
MLNGQRIAAVLPADNAERTIRRTCEEIPHEVVDDVILTDDASADGTAALPANLRPSMPPY